jgi:hypothetical protein
MLETQVDLNNCREASNSRESSCIRDFSEKTTEVRTHFQIDRQQHKRKLEQQGTPTTIGTSEPVETGNTSSRRIFF